MAGNRSIRGEMFQVSMRYVCISLSRGVGMYRENMRPTPP